MKKIALVILVVFCFAYSSFAQTDVEKIIEKADRLSNLDDQPEAAIVEINKAIAIEPQNGRLYAVRANFYRFTENNAEVLNDAQKAAQLSPTDIGRRIRIIRMAERRIKCRNGIQTRRVHDSRKADS